VITAAATADLEDIARLMARSDLLQRYRVTEAGALDSLHVALAEGDALLVSRDDQQHLLGFAWMSFAPRVLDGAAYLRLLIVRDAGRGTGSQLLAEAEHIARSRANHMYLLATTDNAGARRFYEQHGYRYVGDLPGLVWPDLDEALYHKPLRS
jgi:GNAT superfamily N-acetyltransferase